MADDKVVQLPGTEKKPTFADLLKNLVIEMPLQIELIKLKATMARTAYISLKKEDFSDKEALDLCTKIM